jgi:hypothetical protein
MIKIKPHASEPLFPTLKPERSPDETSSVNLETGLFTAGDNIHAKIHLIDYLSQ